MQQIINETIITTTSFIFPVPILDLVTRSICQIESLRSLRYLTRKRKEIIKERSGPISVGDISSKQPV